MKIGNVELENNVFLAPMAGVTDLPFRLICREMGCALVYTEMVSAKAMMYKNKKTYALLDTLPEERPRAVQLFGSDPEILAETAAAAAELDIDIIDINMGCPAPKVIKNGEGSALLRDPGRIGAIVRAVSGAQAKPVTIKIRKGFDDLSVNAVEICRIAEDAGAAAVAIHGRTTRQMYSGCADWDIIKEAKAAVSIPIIGNGDVCDPASAKRMLEYTGCDAIMVGRAAQGNPWIFREISEYLKNGRIIPRPGPFEKASMAKRHLELLIEYNGEHMGVLKMRKHLAWYSKGMRNAAELRDRVNRAEKASEIHEIIDKFFI